MIKKLKINLLVVALALFAGFNSVNAADITYSVDTTVDLSSPDINLTILANSVATSVVVGTGSVVATVPASGVFRITSADRYFNFSGETEFGVINTSCASPTLATLTITAPAGSAQTITITPGGSACSPGGGGGGSYTPPVTPPVIPAIPATPAVVNVIPGCGNRTTGFSTATGVSCVGNTGTIPAVPATPTIPGCGNRSTGFSITTGGSCVGNVVSAVATSYNFGSKTLKNGSRGDAVMELQRFLNAKLNLGLVLDGMLGPKTIAVIKQWQKANGLKADGLVGAKTKAKMNAQAN